MQNPKNVFYNNDENTSSLFNLIDKIIKISFYFLENDPEFNFDSFNTLNSLSASNNINILNNNEVFELEKENEFKFNYLILKVKEAILNNLFNNEIQTINKENVYELKEKRYTNDYNEVDIKFNNSDVILNINTQLLLHGYILYTSYFKLNSVIKENISVEERNGELKWIIKLIINKILSYLIKKKIINLINNIKYIYEKEYCRNRELIKFFPESIESLILDYIKKQEFYINEKINDSNYIIKIDILLGKYELDICLIQKTFTFVIEVNELYDVFERKLIMEEENNKSYYLFKNIKVTKKRIIKSFNFNTSMMNYRLKELNSLNKINDIIYEYI